MIQLMQMMLHDKHWMYDLLFLVRMVVVVVIVIDFGDKLFAFKTLQKFTQLHLVAMKTKKLLTCQRNMKMFQIHTGDVMR